MSFSDYQLLCASNMAYEVASNANGVSSVGECPSLISSAIWSIDGCVFQNVLSNSLFVDCPIRELLIRKAMTMHMYFISRDLKVFV